MFGLQVAWRSPLRNESVVLGTDGHAASFFAANVDRTPARSTIQQDEEPMCRICLATAALVVAGTTSNRRTDRAGREEGAAPGGPA